MSDRFPPGTEVRVLVPLATLHLWKYSDRGEVIEKQGARYLVRQKHQLVHAFALLRVLEHQLEAVPLLEKIGELGGAR